MPEPAGYVRERLRKGRDFTVFRGPQPGNGMPVLALALAAEQPSPQILRSLQQEYSLGAEIDPAWPVKPLTLTGDTRRTILVHKDPDGDPLHRVLEREKERPLDITRSLHIATGLTTAPGQMHLRRRRSSPAPSPIWRPTDRPDDSLD